MAIEHGCLPSSHMPSPRGSSVSHACMWTFLREQPEMSHCTRNPLMITSDYSEDMAHKIRSILPTVSDEVCSPLSSVEQDGGRKKKVRNRRLKKRSQSHMEPVYVLRLWVALKSKCHGWQIPSPALTTGLSSISDESTCVLHSLSEDESARVLHSLSAEKTLPCSCSERSYQSSNGFSLLSSISDESS